MSEQSNYHYVGLMFESKYNSTKENPKFYGRVYNYKTNQALKEGQVVTITTNYGQSRVCIVRDNVPEEEVLKNMTNIGLTLDDVKEF